MQASVLFIACNHGRFVARAIRSAMAQDYRPLELVVCDDASTDDTREILERELQACPAHIRVVRIDNPRNLGLLATFNRGMAACTGDVIFPMAGDDISLPARVPTVMKVFADHPRCMLVFSNWIRIDEADRELPGACRFQEDRNFCYDGLPDDIYAAGKGPGATACYRSRIFGTFGDMELGSHPEDRCYWVRALLLGELRFLAEPLVKWRTHDGNLSHYRGGHDTAAARARIARDLRNRQNYGRQFVRDIRHALQLSLIQPGLAKHLCLLIRRDRERERLRRFSLARAPWRLWLAAARRLLAVAPTPNHIWRVLFTEPLIRMSKQKRQRQWTKWLGKHHN